MPIFTPKSERKAESRITASTTLQREISQQASSPSMDSALTSMGAYHYEHRSVQRRAINAEATGMPDATHSDELHAQGTYSGSLPVNIQSGIQALSGFNLDTVKVHYNSSKPAQMNALAYAQGSHIYLGQGQEKHLPHEAWHVVQQAQGRVRPTLQMKGGTLVNDDRGLETEADVMGANALAAKSDAPQIATRPPLSTAMPVVQGVFTKRNIDGEEKDAPPLEVLVAERRLQKSGASRSAFRDIRLSDKRVNLNDFMAKILPPEETTAKTRPLGPMEHIEQIVAEDPVVLIDTRFDQPVAVISRELIEAYRADLINENAQFLQEGEGNAIAQYLDVTAYVMNQVSGPLIQSNGIHYGDGEGVGFLLHIHGNHYIVIAQTHNAMEMEYIDTDGNGYFEVMPTVVDGNCLIDGLYIIKHHEHASPSNIRMLRAIADEGITDLSINAALTTIITDFAQGIHPSGVGSRTMRLIRRDPRLLKLYEDAGKERANAQRKSWRKEKPKKRSRNDSLEEAVTKYVLECNRLGEKAVRGSTLRKKLSRLWSDANQGQKLPDHKTLAKWIADKETKTGEYYGSDTESDSSDDDAPSDDDDQMLAAAYEFSADDEAVLKRLNTEITAAKTKHHVEAILRKKEYAHFVVPQYRGIAYMTNRFGKKKRHEHRKSSQLGVAVFADAVRPKDKPREEFYTTEHGIDSAAMSTAKEHQTWLAQKRKPDPFIDKSRKVGKPPRNRVFPTPFHAVQSDYSENYTKSAQTIAKYHAKIDEEQDDEAVEESALDKVYKGVPFRSHPFVSTADEAKHAARYALGNKPIEAEKEFRLRPRWHKSGKPQHPYSGKVYVSLHPLRDYLSPHAPSHVWSGRKLGALSINNDTSKEGESSFLAMLKHGRVAVEQVIRWPSLTEDKDDMEEFGISSEMRQLYRQILERAAPHSSEQKEMKSKNLGPWMEAYFVALIERRTKAEAVRRNQKLIYRGITGNFQSIPPTYMTPTQTAQKSWGAPKLEKQQESLFEKIRTGKQRYGGLTEGYFDDWPAEEVYEDLSDEEFAHDVDFDRNMVIALLIERIESIRDETLTALRHLQRNNDPAVSTAYRAAATALAHHAWLRIAANAQMLNIDNAIVGFPEIFAQEIMPIDDDQMRAAATAAHINALAKALIDLTSEAMQHYTK